ncbi:Os03g0183850, partial [Oryza sativa Japonica Group]
MNPWYSYCTPNYRRAPSLAHIAVTDDPEHVIPCHDWPQGSPPLACQPLSCPGEFRLVKSVLRTLTIIRVGVCSDQDLLLGPNAEAAGGAQEQKRQPWRIRSSHLLLLPPHQCSHAL